MSGRRGRDKSSVVWRRVSKRTAAIVAPFSSFISKLWARSTVVVPKPTLFAEGNDVLLFLWTADFRTALPVTSRLPSVKGSLCYLTLLQASCQLPPSALHPPSVSMNSVLRC